MMARTSEDIMRWPAVARKKVTREGVAPLILAAACLSLGQAGCGDPYGVGPTVPVVGKVTVDGQPVKAGTISFRPDKSKGNTSVHEPYGEIDAEGNYKLFTGKKAGAPVGWYKVAVFAGEPVEVGNLSGQAKWYANPKDASADTSGLTIEVVAKPEPGAYDLKLIK
jgi:hypothetical protein